MSVYNRSLIECSAGEHRFEARYEDSKPISLDGMRFWSCEEAINFLEAHKRKLYIKDICVKCGKEIKR